MTAFSPYQAYPDPTPEYQNGPPPVLVAVADLAPQRRLTVLIRLILLVPHLIVLYLLLLVSLVVVFLGWWGALFTGRLPEWIGSFLAGYLRWSARVVAYELLLTDVYPPFSFDDEPAYPVRLALPAPQRLNRAAVLFRVILTIPASFVATVLIFGSGTLMSFIAWVITLVTGRLPVPFHGAFTAVLRYQLRYYAYWWMLTPAYPSGLFGDKPGIGTWADEAAAPGGAFDVPAGPGYGTAESVYGYPAGPGYGYGSGYGAQAGYGGQPFPQPTNWTLLLTSGGRKLVTTFIVLGTLFWLADVGFQGLSISRSASNAVAASRALVALGTSYVTLENQVTTWEVAVRACGSNLTCATGQDGKAATYFSAFASQVQSIRMPASADPAAARLEASANAAAQDLMVLSQSTTASQYQSTTTSTGLNQTIARLNKDFEELDEELASF